MFQDVTWLQDNHLLTPSLGGVGVNQRPPYRRGTALAGFTSEDSEEAMTLKKEASLWTRLS